MKYQQLYKYIHEESLKGKVGNLKSRLQTIFESLQFFAANKGETSIKVKCSELKSICDSILSVAQLLEENLRIEAHSKLYNICFAEGSNLSLKTYTLKKDAELYRMRSANTFAKYTKESSEEMYHIPFELRYKVGNARFNIPGFPIFYLASSVYGCWEEMKRTDLDFANVALFKPTKDLIFLDLTLPNSNKAIDASTILTLPLILASRMKVERPEENYIPEYSIPQMIMECLIAMRNKNANPESNIIGIRYGSIHQDERDLLFDETYKDDMFVNYAIPPFEVSERGVCPKIKQLFEFWNNTSWAEIKYRNIDVSSCDSQTHYEQSVFGVIEHRLNLIAPGVLLYKTKRKGGIPPGALNIKIT